MVQIAHFSLILALLCAGYVVVASLTGLKTRDRRWFTSAAHALGAIAGLLTLTIILLLYFLLQRDFRLEYVASYTDISLPLGYVISALWAGQKGSFLLWTWMFSVCSLVCIRNYQKHVVTSDHDLLHILKGQNIFHPEFPYIALVLALKLGFFLSLLVFKTNPFTLLSSVPLNGNGLNPLLQNPYMVIHPPVLFLGYAGFGIPFALAFAVLCTGTIDRLWLRTMRRWVLFSWYCLGFGILLGAHWAYLELGWGGYWAWDPVENGSLIPWLTSTALLHTLILQQRKGFLRRWNIFLGIFTFSLCVFATFITRSGVLASVHAYAQSPVGLYFLAFLATTFVCATGGMAYRWKTIRSQSEYTALISKKNSFLLANQLFMGLGFAVLYGTIYPLLSELITGKNIAITPSFFNRISIPIGLCILGLLGVCQGLPWKHVSQKALWLKSLISPGTAALATMILLLLFGVTQISTLLTCSFGVLVVSPLLVHIRKLLQPASVFHLGTVLMCIGIAISSTYKLEKEVELSPGESSTLGHIRFQYVKLDSYEDEQKGVMFAEVALYNNEDHITTVIPEKRFYGQTPDYQMTTEVGLRMSLKEDIYVILEGWDEEQRATFLFIIHPMIIWIWIGGFVIFTVGMILAAKRWRLAAERQQA